MGLTAKIKVWAGPCFWDSRGKAIPLPLPASKGHFFSVCKDSNSVSFCNVSPASPSHFLAPVIEWGPLDNPGSSPSPRAAG